LTAAAAPFDALAAHYDAEFTVTPLGQRLRRAVWRHLDAAFPEGSCVLDLGCGTGEDAVHLAARGISVHALDASPAMTDAALAKAAREGVAARVRVETRPIEALNGLPDRPFDGAYSNFGALNCVADLGGVARSLAPLLRPGAPLVVVLMGRSVPWEWAWHLTHGAPRTAFRRYSRRGVPWRGLTVFYPTTRAVRKALAPGFDLRGMRAIGALLPPTYAGGWAGRHPRLFEALDRTERRLEAVWPLPLLADHILFRFERRG
jgi:SAM-dependent methyltransferase